MKGDCSRLVSPGAHHRLPLEPINTMNIQSVQKEQRTVNFMTVVALTTLSLPFLIVQIQFLIVRSCRPVVQVYAYEKLSYPTILPMTPPEQM